MSRPTVRNKKIRKNITMDAPIAKKAKKLAFDRGLSLSSWIGQLIRVEIQKDKGGDA